MKKISNGKCEMDFKKRGLLLLILLMLLIMGDTLLKSVMKEQNASEEAWVPPVETAKESKEEKEDVFEKGYYLPIEEEERKEAEAACKSVMKLISELYKRADKGSASNVVIPDKTVRQMQDKIKETKCPVTSSGVYANMENYEDMENFLKACIDGKSGSIVIYKVYSDGGIGRYQYRFDGTDMYVLCARAIWNEENEPGIGYISNHRINKWEYTDKGWFCYELCVPEPPEVTEILDGNCMIRVMPIKEELRKISEKCVFLIGYQGNNLLCSDWDTEHLEDLDYNGMYDCLYRMKYQKNVDTGAYQNGIPKEEFENIIMEYIPVTKEQLEKYAVFDEENQVYKWESLGCFNYSPDFLGTAVPEVTDMKENEEGEIRLTVDAVCEMILCDDAVITHELTIRLEEDGSFQYLSNKILEDGLDRIPDYQYRLGKEGHIYE